MSSLEARKQLLLLESELNRAQMVQEWQTMAESFSSVAGRAKSISSVALAGAVLVAGLMYFRRVKTVLAGKRPKWWQALLGGVKLAASLWTEFSPRPKPQREI